MGSAHPRSRMLAFVCATAAFLLSAPGGSWGQSAANPEANAPRSVSDIIKVLEHYKPDTSAVNAAREVLARPMPASEDRTSLFRHHYARGTAANTLGDNTLAIAELNKARQYMDANELEGMLALGDLATFSMSSGNLLTALEAVNQRLAFGYAQRNQGYIITTAINGVAVYVALGDFENARRTLTRAEQAEFETFRNSQRFGLYRHYYAYYIERMRGAIASSEGKPAAAESAFRKALRELEADRPDREERTKRSLGHETDEVREANRGRIHRSLAQVLLVQGRLNAAELHIRTALQISLERVGRSSFDTIFDLASYSRILLEQGRFPESTLIAREAVRSAETSGMVPYARALISARRSLGAALVSSGKWQEALKVFAEMRAEAATEPELAKVLATGDLDEAHTLIKVGQAQAARTLVQGILAKSEQLYGKTDPRTAEVRGFHAVAMERSGSTNEALAEFAASVPILTDQVRNAAANDSGSVRRVKRLEFILNAYIGLLARVQQTGQRPPSVDPVSESFRLADIARGSDVQRALSASAARANIRDPALAELARKEQDAQRRIASLSDILRTLLAASPAQQLPAVIAQMRKDIDVLTQERTDSKREIERRFPDYAELVDPKPASIASVQASLRAGETLISIYTGEENTFVWAVPKTGNPRLAHIPLDSAQIAQTVERLRKALDPQASTIEDIPAFDLAVAGKLYDDLLKPVESAWKGTSQHLFIVPHGALGQLPFGLLPTATVETARSALHFSEYSAVPWLIRETAITQLPSVTALGTLRRTPAPPANRRSYVGIGDPLFSKEQAATALQTASLRPATRGIPVRLRSAPRTSGIDSAELALLPRLPDTAEEISEIARSLGANSSKDVLLGRDANEAAVKGMNLADRQIIHFATHGLVPGELNGLTQPALALTAPEVAGVDGDGLLTMDEILGLKLNADWVVLSACNTASGDGAGSEAVSGLGRAFFYAGARALLVSNWPVESVASRLLMSDIFRRYAASPAQAKAESLRQAMIGMIDGPGSVDPATGKTAYAYAHPLFWAPFVLVGD